MNMVIFTGGEAVWSNLIEEEVQGADMIVAADSGATIALSHGIVPHRVIGDFDSIDAKTKAVLEEKEIQFEEYPTKKDQTDTELAIQYVTEQGATKIAIVAGDQGDRIDHVLGNIFLATQSSVPIAFLNGQQKAWVEKGPRKITISGKKNDLLSLIPFSGNVENVVSDGLEWELKNETLLFGLPRGISNVFTLDSCKVTIGNGLLFLVHTKS